MVFKPISEGYYSNIVDFLCEYEAICETSLGHESGQ
jgi:hypothetical protein